MARLFDGTDDYLTHAAAVLTAVPITMACWFKKKVSASANYALVSITDSAAAINRNTWSLRLNNSNSGSVMSISALACSATSTAIGSAFSPLTSENYDNVWVHGTAVFAAANSRTAYFDGVAGTTSTTTRTPTASTTTSVGAEETSSGFATFANADIGEAAIWNVALTAAEIASLASGYCPLAIRSASLVAYYPLDGRFSPERDPVGGYELTVDGVTYADHPRVIYSLPQLAIGVPTAGGNQTQNNAGSCTPSGALTKLVTKPLAGSATPSGTLAKVTSKPLAGSATPAGSITGNTVSKSLAGSTTSSGATTQVTSKAASGSCTGSGSASQTCAKPLAGSSTPTGTATKLVSKATSGSSTPSGTESHLKVALQSLSGSTTPSGVATRLTLKALVGTCTATGAMTSTGGSPAVSVAAVITLAVHFARVQESVVEFRNVQGCAPRFPRVQPDEIKFSR